MLPLADIIMLRDSGQLPVSAGQLAFASAYRNLYHLNIDSATHEMGWLSVGEEQVFVQWFAPESGQRGTVFLLHGYLDHSGIQGSTIRRLLGLGFNVVAIDHAGHGLSSGPRASVDSFDLYIAGVSAAATHYRQLPQPHVLMGHSLGGAIAMTHMLEFPGEFTTGVLVAPLYRPLAWPIVRVAHGLGRRFITRQKRVWRANTRDAAFRHFIREVDPLSPHYIPTAWISAMANWIRHFQSLPAVEARVMVVQGSADGTVDWRVNLPMIERKFSDVSLQIIEQGRHHLLNELEEWREKAWAPILPFLANLDSAGRA